MPIKVVSQIFSDEFITGFTTNFTNGVLGDKWEATLNIEYSNIIDASVGVNNSAFIWHAYDSSSIVGQIGGKQVFEPNQDLSGLYSSEVFELQNLIGASFAVTNFNGTINGAYTIQSVVQGINTPGAFAVVCSESVTGTLSANTGRLAITEDLTTANLDYSTWAGVDPFKPTIRIGNSNSNFSTTSAILDAGSATIIPIPFKYNGAYQTGGLTIQGKGISGDVQSFELVHSFGIIPISIYSDTNTGFIEPSDSGIDLNDYNIFINQNSGINYQFGGGFSNSVVGGISPTIDTTNYLTNSNAQNIGVYGYNYQNSTTSYSVSNLAIVRTLDSYVTGVPIVEEKFTVTFNVDNTNNTPFSDGNTKVKVGIENLPENIGNTEDYEQTYLSDYALEVLGAAAGSGDAVGDALSISNYTATFVSTSQISISFDVDFTSNAQTQIGLSDLPYFSIYVVTQDHLLDYTNSDRSIINVFNGLGITRVLEDPIMVNNTQFITAPYNDFTNGIDSSEIDGFPVMSLVGSTSFYADWDNRPELRIDSINQSLVLKNTSTLEEIPLENTTINVNAFSLIDSEYPDTNNYSVQKGFKIPSTEVRNLISMDNISDVSSVRTFEVFFPFFVRWEEYTELIMNAIPSSILDNNEPFDGKNYDLYRIDALANWELSYRVNFGCSEEGATFSQDFDYVIPTSTYNSHPDITNREIKSYKLDGITELISGSEKFIDNAANTLIVYESTFNVAPLLISDFEIELWIEAFENGSPTKIQRISSVNNILNSSWFTSTDNSGLVTKTISGSKAIGTVYIDNNLLAPYDYYTIYGTIYDPKRPTEYLLTESGDNFTTESGDKLIKDF